MLFDTFSQPPHFHLSRTRSFADLPLQAPSIPDPCSGFAPTIQNSTCHIPSVAEPVNHAACILSGRHKDLTPASCLHLESLLEMEVPARLQLPPPSFRYPLQHSRLDDVHHFSNGAVTTLVADLPSPLRARPDLMAFPHSV
jgi:hypothetical protein